MISKYLSVQPTTYNLYILEILNSTQLHYLSTYLSSSTSHETLINSSSLTLLSSSCQGLAELSSNSYQVEQQMHN